MAAVNVSRESGLDGWYVGTMSLEDVAHLRDLMYASLAEEANYLVQHAHEARSGTSGCNEDAEAASRSVRRTCALLDQIGWTA
jgi:hypothetical protein